jgi:hypothetical protein
VIRLFSGGAIERPPGQLASAVPKQTEPEVDDRISVGDFTLTPRARYEIEARVLSTERYRVDPGAALAPIDFAVGWGPMSDTSVIEHFRVTQGARFYTIYPDERAIDIGTALRSSANMHLIPADNAVRATLMSVRPGNIVALRGILVAANRPDGFIWNTSLTRDDTGNGACELMYVRSASKR